MTDAVKNIHTLCRVGYINDRLRELRESAKPRISLQKMADELGLESRQAYHFYERERGFKQPLLPMSLARRIASVLGKRGVNPSEVMKLAGVDRDESPPQLSDEQEQWLDAFDDLNSDQRRLLLELAKSMGNGFPTGATIHSGRVTYLAQPEERA